MTAARLLVDCVLVGCVLMILGTAMVFVPLVENDHLISCDPPADVPPKKGGRG